jgi:NAD(P)-dependent dehydrogenase (short-subunit alcohol dehydrogenase family)
MRGGRASHLRAKRAMSALLEGKMAVVTGAARGIGRAVCEAFAREGASVFGIDIVERVSRIQRYAISTPADLEDTGSLVRKHGVRWVSGQGDVRDIGRLRQLAAEVIPQFGGLDILACVAGIQAFKPLLDMEDEDWSAQIDTNLTGTANCIRVFAPLLVARGSGRIIVTSSTQGRHGMRNGSAYSTSKWGLLGLMKSAALELGAFHITVNAVVPGLIDTPLTRHEARYRQALEEANAGQLPPGSLEQQAEEVLRKKTPLGVPWLAADAVASAYVFLASDAAYMVSGATYDVTGGDSAHNS